MDEVLDMRLERRQIAHLAPHEIRPQHLPRVLPRGAIGREDAFPQEWSESVDPPRPEAEVPELRRHDGFEIFWLDGHVDDLAHQLELKGVDAHLPEAAAGPVEEASVLQVPEGFEEKVEAEEVVPGGVTVGRFTAMLLDHATAAGAGGQLPVDIIDDVEGGDAQ